MTFATRTFDEIRDAYLRDLRLAIPGIRTTEGSLEWVRATALANSLLPVYANGAHLAKQAFPDTCDATNLARFGNTYGVARLGAQYAAGTIAVTASYGLPLADATTLVNRSTGARYETIGITSIDPVTLSGTAYVVALQEGAGSNADAGTVLTFEGAPPGVDSNATVIAITGGDTAWDTGRWAIEIGKRMRQTPLAGNVAHVTAICHAISGVEQAFVYPALRGAGTLDVVVLTSAASGDRIAGTALLTRVLGALQAGVTTTGGTFLGGLPEDVFRNTTVAAAVAKPTDLRIDFTASSANDWDEWPPFGTGYMTPGTVASWYLVGAVTSNTSFSVTKPGSGTAVAPVVGQYIGAFFEDHGFCKARITGVVDAGAAWTLTVSTWQDSNASAPATTLATLTPIVPWCSQLPAIAGAPAEDSLALSGVVPDYFAGLGPGEMTPLTADDVSRRRRWPRPSDTNPITGQIEWPTDVTSRLLGALLRGTDASSATITATTTTPTVPSGAYIGAPPKLLTLGALVVIPTTA